MRSFNVANNIDLQTDERPEPPRKRAPLNLALAGLALLALAAGLLWYRFGPTVFFNALNAAWTCF